MVIRESCLSQIRPFYRSEMIKVITGVRRSGKSTLLRQIIEELVQSGISNDRILYVNFEDYAYRSLCDPDALYAYIEEKTNGKGTWYLLFDEIQNVDHFERVVNSFRATKDVSIFLTGSNSRLLSGELATVLSGRTLSFRVMPFNFREFIQFRSEQSDTRTSEELLDVYLTWGGFPLVCREDDDRNKEVILSNIYDSVVLKDVIMRNRITSPAALERVLAYVIGNSSVTISGNSIAAALSDKNQKVSSPTVYDFIKYIEDACICDKVARYDIRGKKALAFQEKIYVCDPGFYRLKKNRIKSEYGHLIETICYNDLISKGYKVFIGKTLTGEVDFIAERGAEKFYLQVAYLLSDEHIIDREFGAFSEIPDHYPKYVVSRDRTTLTRDGIIHKNLVDFLLSDE